jgi:hypothetical protein
MYRKLLAIVVTCCPLLCAAKAPAEAEPIYWDIGKEPSISLRLEPGKYRLIVKGMVGNANYGRNLTVDTIPIPGLPALGSVPVPFKAAEKPKAGPAAAHDPSFTERPDPCAAYNTSLTALSNDALDKYNKPDLAKRGAEEQFTFALLRLKSAIAIPPAKCSADADSQQILATLAAASRGELGTFIVERGQIVKAEVLRALGEGSAALKFTYEGSTGKRGSWQASHGFGVTPNNDRQYFSKAGDDDTFAITQKRDNGGVQPNAAVFYTWLPAAWENKYCHFGIAGGIGVDQNNLVLLLGPHITFNQNLGLVAGIALHQEKRLRGEYDVGQVLTESLTSDALEEKVGETTWFVGITYRFAESEK